MFLFVFPLGGYLVGVPAKIGAVSAKAVYYNVNTSVIAMKSYCTRSTTAVALFLKGERGNAPPAPPSPIAASLPQHWFVTQPTDTDALRSFRVAARYICVPLIRRYIFGDVNKRFVWEHSLVSRTMQNLVCFKSARTQ